MEDTIINFGSEIKSLGDNKIGGYLVLFSDESSPDLAGDFFTKDTDFGFEGSMKTAVWLNHRKPLRTKDKKQIVVKEKIGEGTLTKDDNGILIEAILFERDQYEKALSKMGWSSGTASHLTEREKKGDAQFVKQWFLGLDASVTPRPCEPRTSVTSLKSWIEELESDDDSQTLKGILSNKVAENRMQTWELWSAFSRLSEDIAQAASTSDITGTEIDISTKVNEAVNELALLLSPIVTKQIQDYIQSGTSERFYLKSNPEVFHNLISGAPHAGRFEDRLDMTLGVIERVANDAKQIHELRSMKMGAKISQARMAKLKEIGKQLSTLLAEVEGEEAPKDEKSVDESLITSLVANFEYQKMMHQKSIA